ncbi:MAG: MFS transporter [Ornithinibacter sp.]
MALHAQGSGIPSAAQVPLLFAVAMAVDGLTGPVAGRAYDRVGPRVLLLVPVAAATAAISFAARTALVWVGVAVWGVVNGILDSVVKAVITQLVEAEQRAAAFGWLALARGAGLLIAGVALGVAYQRSPWAAAGFIVVVNAGAVGPRAGPAHLHRRATHQDLKSCRAPRQSTPTPCRDVGCRPTPLGRRVARPGI